MKKILVVLVLVGLLLGFGGSVIDGMVRSSQLETLETQVVVVGSGDSIWTFVNMVEGRDKVDGHSLVAKIRQMNDLEPSDHLMPGQRLTIPKEVR